jgi:hypothetical protein
MSDRARMTTLVAKWGLLTPEQREAAKKEDRKVTEHRATEQEMAERREVVEWLVKTAGRPLSRRGVAYRAEVLLGYPKTAHAFRLIDAMTVTLREDGTIPFAAIRDGRRRVLYHGRWDKLAEHLEAAADRHRLDLWADAPVQAQVWIEKADLADALSTRASEELGLSVYPSSGNDGLSFLYAQIEQAALDVYDGDGERIRERPRPLVLFELRDFDSSGNRAREVFRRKVRKYARRLDVKVEAIVPVALTREQVDEYELPTRPQKENQHYRPDDDDDDACELDAVDALHPDLLGDWLAAAVEPYLAPYREAVEGREERDRRVIATLVDKLPEAEAEVDDGVDR